LPLELRKSRISACRWSTVDFSNWLLKTGPSAVPWQGPGSQVDWFPADNFGKLVIHGCSSRCRSSMPMLNVCLWNFCKGRSQLSVTNIGRMVAMQPQQPNSVQGISNTGISTQVSVHRRDHADVSWDQTRIGMNVIQAVIATYKGWVGAAHWLIRRYYVITSFWRKQPLYES